MTLVILIKDKLVYFYGFIGHEETYHNTSALKLIPVGAGSACVAGIGVSAQL